MNSNQIKQIIEKINQLFQEKGQETLSDLEARIIFQSLEGKSYQQMQIPKNDKENYSEDYLKQTKIWSRLSKLLNNSITKGNVKFILPDLLPNKTIQLNNNDVEEENSFYIEHVKDEANILESVKNQGCVIHIKAPPKFGKTWFMQRILKYAIREYGHESVYLSFNQINKKDMKDYEQFLSFFCWEIWSQLKETNDLPEETKPQWSEEININTQCTNNLKRILKAIENPLVLCLDDIDMTFDVVPEFLALLRYWCDEAQYHSILGKLRIITARYNEISDDLIPINSSPFNVGTYPQLLDFTKENIKELAKKYGSDWKEKHIEKLMKLVGGHPELVKRALRFYKKPSDKNVEDFINKASTEESIYRSYLRKLLKNLKSNYDDSSKLPETLDKVLQQEKSVETKEYDASNQLYNMGLIVFDGNKIKLRYELYRDYLTTHRIKQGES